MQAVRHPAESPWSRRATRASCTNGVQHYQTRSLSDDPARYPTFVEHTMPSLPVPAGRAPCCSASWGSRVDLRSAGQLLSRYPRSISPADLGRDRVAGRRDPSHTGAPLEAHEAGALLPVQCQPMPRLATVAPSARLAEPGAETPLEIINGHQRVGVFGNLAIGEYEIPPVWGAGRVPRLRLSRIPGRTCRADCSN